MYLFLNIFQLNIPMNLPHFNDDNIISNATYEDDTIPLRVHDSTLDLQVVSNSNGIVCICHHYVYEVNLYEKCCYGRL